MSQAADAELCYLKRHLAALEMAAAATDPAVRNIHLEMARQYKQRAGEGDSASQDDHQTTKSWCNPLTHQHRC